MEDGLKISELNQATIIGDEDLIPIVQNGETKHIEKSDLFADINNKLSYSTTEQVVGTWNGKPLYRKVLNVAGNLTLNAWTTIGTLSNVDTLITGKIFDSSSKAVWNEVMVRVNSNNIQYYQALSLAHVYSGAILEYTKTTD